MTTLRSALDAVLQTFQGAPQTGPPPEGTPPTGPVQGNVDEAVGLVDVLMGLLGQKPQTFLQPRPQVTFQERVSPDALLRGVVPQDLGLRATFQERTRGDPGVEREIALARQAVALDAASPEQIQLLLAAGELTETQARTAFGRLAGDAGDGSSALATAMIRAQQQELDRAEFKRQFDIEQAQLERQRRFERQQGLLKTVQAEQTLAQDRISTLLSTILEAAPMMPFEGQEFFGGFGPSGGGTLLELLQGGAGEPIPISTTQLPIGRLEEEADVSDIEALLGPLV